MDVLRPRVAERCELDGHVHGHVERKPVGTGLHLREQRVPRTHIACLPRPRENTDVPVVQLYYSASSFGSQNSAIFYATSKTGAPGSFTNGGLVISTSSSSNYNAIDPKYVHINSSQRQRS